MFDAGIHLNIIMKTMEILNSRWIRALHTSIDFCHLTSVSRQRDLKGRLVVNVRFETNSKRSRLQRKLVFILIYLYGNTNEFVVWESAVEAAAVIFFPLVFLTRLVTFAYRNKQIDKTTLRKVRVRYCVMLCKLLYRVLKTCRSKRSTSLTVGERPIW